MSRREISRSLVASIGFAALPLAHGEETRSGVERSLLRSGNWNPRWYGFNQLECFSAYPDWMKHFPARADGAFREDDFRWMRDWRFHFARLPMGYRFWTDMSDPSKIDEQNLEPIDRAIRLGEQYGVHVDICLHRAPGHCILDCLNPWVTGIQVIPERMGLFTDSHTLDAFVFQWTAFAKRYKGISSDHLSFNLLNEPKIIRDPARTMHGTRSGNSSHEPVRQMSLKQGAKDNANIVRAAIDGIQEVDPDRLIVIDGFDVAEV